MKISILFEDLFDPEVGTIAGDLLEFDGVIAYAFHKATDNEALFEVQFADGLARMFKLSKIAEFSIQQTKEEKEITDGA